MSMEKLDESLVSKKIENNEVYISDYFELFPEEIEKRGWFYFF